MRAKDPRGWNWRYANDDRSPPVQLAQSQWPTQVIADLPAELKCAEVGGDTAFRPEQADAVRKIVSVVSPNTRILMKVLPNGGTDYQNTLIAVWCGGSSSVVPMFYLRRMGNLFILSRFFVPDILVGKRASYSAYLNFNEAALAIASDANTIERGSNPSGLSIGSGLLRGHSSRNPTGFSGEVIRAVAKLATGFGVQSVPQTIMPCRGRRAMIVFHKAEALTIVPQIHIDRIGSNYRAAVWSLPEVIEYGAPRITTLQTQDHMIDWLQQTLALIREKYITVCETDSPLGSVPLTLH